MATELWELVWGRGEVDPSQLAAAIEKELAEEQQDFRTRLLIRDSTLALAKYWGKDRLEAWLRSSNVREKIERIRGEDLGEPGFPRLGEHLMERTEPAAVNEYLREIGVRLHKANTLKIGGSIALILPGYLSRATSDIDIVDEVPESIRNEHDLLSELQQRYQLQLTHFQSHYLPDGWEERLKFQGAFGHLQIYLVDVYDVFLGKLFSKRKKDLDDLRALKPQLEKQILVSRLQLSGRSLCKDSSLKESAETNWYILFGEKLPEISEPD